ncbi:hypothetical protein CWI66_06925 [Halomonas sp. 141]|nr:hypothetical protein CWI66_06925 [Halomonas sp. 141]
MLAGQGVALACRLSPDTAMLERHGLDTHEIDRQKRNSGEEKISEQKGIREQKHTDEGLPKESD